MGVQLLDDATASASSNGTKRQRRNRFDEDASEDLGPFEAALSQRQQAQLPTASSAEVMDLGPFEAVLPPKDIEDLGTLRCCHPRFRVKVTWEAAAKRV